MCIPFTRLVQAQLLGELCKRVLSARKDKVFDEHHMAMAAKLVEMNPEMYTVWNYRREYLQPIFEKGGDAAVDAVQTELSISEKALMRNPKSYATFHHRRWLVSTGFCSLEKELKLVEILLDSDERNFHGWGYRRFIAKCMGLPVSRELEYSKKKIEQNFSNYSAWHHRSTILPLMNGDRSDRTEDVSKCGSSEAVSDIPLDVLQEELRFVRQACYTDPIDQSGWFYHRWLLGCLGKQYLETKDDDQRREDIERILQGEVAMCDEVHSLEPKAKWPVLTAIQIKLAIETRFGGTIPSSLTSRDADLKVLGSMDPMRQNFYKDLQAGQANPWASLTERRQ